MSFDYASLRDNDVDPIIEEFGQDVTLTVKGVSSHDADSGAVSESSANHTIKGVLDNQQKVYQDGKLVTDDRKRLLVSPSGMSVVPKVNDEIIVNSETFKITQVLETKPRDVVVLYELVLEN